MRVELEALKKKAEREQSFDSELKTLKLYSWVYFPVTVNLKTKFAF